MNLFSPDSEPKAGEPRVCEIHIDGGSRGNPGPASAGVVLRWRDEPEPFHEAGYFLGQKTNNFAEYQALLQALDIALGQQVDRIHIYSDSQLLVRQIIGQYRVKSENIRPLYAQAVEKLAKFEDWSIDHVRRELNQRADQLANRAMDARDDVIATN